MAVALVMFAMASAMARLIVKNLMVSNALKAMNAYTATVMITTAQIRLVILANMVVVAVPVPIKPSGSKVEAAPQLIMPAMVVAAATLAKKLMGRPVP